LVAEIIVGGTYLKIVAALALFFFIASPHSFAQSKPVPGKPAAGKAAAGKKDFEVRCAACHGMDASGKTPMADTMGGIPDLHSKGVQSLTDAKIKKTITEGTDKMPAVPDVSDEEVANLIAFIRSLGKK
jgi:mono/diheme cytochrome c family protein